MTVVMHIRISINGARSEGYVTELKKEFLAISDRIFEPTNERSNVRIYNSAEIMTNRRRSTEKKKNKKEKKQDV